MTIGPVVLLGLLSIFFMLTTVRSSMMEEIEEGLKGTAAATLAAYDQNTGDYMESSNGDIWKGSYNISPFREPGGSYQGQHRNGCDFFLRGPSHHDFRRG